MDKFVTKRNDLLAEQVIKNLKSRQMEGHYVQTKEEALALALENTGFPLISAYHTAFSTLLTSAIPFGNVAAHDRNGFQKSIFSDLCLCHSVFSLKFSVHIEKDEGFEKPPSKISVCIIFICPEPLQIHLQDLR